MTYRRCGWRHLGRHAILRPGQRLHRCVRLTVRYYIRTGMIVMLRVLVALPLALTLALGVGVAAPTTVELANPSFDGGANAEGTPVGWTRYGGDAEGLALSVVEVDEGHALLIEDGSPTGEIGVSQDFPVTAGEGYLVTVRARRVGEASAAGAYVQLRFLPSDTYEQVALAPPSADEWSETMVYGMAPADAKSARIYLYTHREPTPKVMVDAVSAQAGAEPPAVPAPAGPMVPEPIPPQYDRLKDLHLTTALVAGGEPAAAIVRPTGGEFDREAEAIAAAIAQITGARVPIITDRDPGAALPAQTNLIVLGNRGANATIQQLYEGFFTLVDAKYPGPGGHDLRSVHNPYGDGHNVIVVGASEPAGVADATTALIAALQAAGGGPGELVVGRLRDVKLSDDYAVPRDPREMRIWEASAYYGDGGFFGWNCISKHMAAYYVTGDEYHAREVLRLSFPDAEAIKYIEEIDGERIENKHDPLAGPYHYSAIMMILFWDLIEEDPVFTDEQRLAITNALSRQLNHRKSEGVYGRAEPPRSVGDRHGDWSAMALYALARYFQRDYPDPIWQCALDSAATYFSAIENSAWLAGYNDHLFWYTSYYDPLLDYMHMSGYRGGMDNLRQALRTQDILFTGAENDWGLRASSLNFLHRAAALTGDGRFIFYRDRTGLDTSGFRLGQSWWPEGIEARPPTELLDTWTLQPMPEPMWRARNSGLPPEQQFLWGAWRNTLDESGDLVMIKGHNGGGRLPYHTFSIMEQRLANRTLLKGYRTQVLTSADGMVEPIVPMDAALVDHGTLGDTCYAIGEVPHMPFAGWQRSFIQRAGRYALFVDDLGFRADSENMKIETEWNTVGGSWNAKRNVLAIPGTGPEPGREGWLEFRALEVPITCGAGPETDLISRLDNLDIVLLKPQQLGDWVEMSFTLEEPISGHVYADLLDYTDRAVVRIWLDGEPIVDGVNHTAASAIHHPVDLGEFELAAGEHRLRVEASARPPGAERALVGLIGASIRPAGVAEWSPPIFELHPSEVMQAQGGGVVVMQWLGTARAGEHRRFFHLLGRRTADQTLACYQVADNAAVLALPEPALAVVGEFEDISAELAVLAGDHLFARGLTAVPLLRATAPVTVAWDFATGELNVAASGAAELTVQAADGPRTLAVAAGQQRIERFEGVTPAPAPLAALSTRATELLAVGEAERVRQLAAAAEPTGPTAPEMTPAMTAQIEGEPVAAVTIPRAGGDLTAIAAGTTVHLLAPDGSVVGTMSTDGAIRVMTWWPEAELLLVGCADEQVIAFGLDGQRRWAFTSEMDQAVWETGKTYWFKSAYPGIHGLATGTFIGGESQAFVGSASTLEILDAQGRLVHRTASLWGPNWKFRIIPGPGESRNLLIALWPNGNDTLTVINSETLKHSTGFYGVPPGHTMVGGWTQQNRTGIEYADLDGDGTGEVVSAINGIFNRVTVFSATGTPLYNAQFGPGPTSAPYSTMRDLAVADLDGDGDLEIVVGISDGLVVALDHECRKVWARRLPSPPTQLEVITPPGAELPVIIAGCEDGTVARLSGAGEIEALGQAGGRVTSLTVSATPEGPLAVTVTATGAVSGWRVE